MCGIAGYVGYREALSVILPALRRIEYRGCDSAGVATVSGTCLAVKKTVGKVTDLELRMVVHRPDGTAGIGHTRWATHGRPSDANAHPHVDCQSKLAVVHNGIIENYRDLRRALAESGHRFRSQTDTEVIAHLIERYEATGLPEAARRAAQELKGTYAVACVAAASPNTLVAFRRGNSPLVVGYGHGEMFVSSDISALLDVTREVLVLEDGELAVLTPEGLTVRKLDGDPVRRRAFTVDGDGDAIEKPGDLSFMLKEILEQPEAIRNTLCDRLDPERPDIRIPELGLKDRELSGLNRLCFVGCGTSWHAGLFGRYLVEEFARLPVEVDLASEFRYRRPVIDGRVLTVPISQSGETVDTLAALHEAMAQGSRAVAICNVVGSSLARQADGVLYTRAGVEIGATSTKAFSAQLVAVTLLALKLGLARGFADPSLVRHMLKALLELPDQLSVVLEQRDAIRRVAEQIADRSHFLFVGQGLGFPLALEGAGKLKETCPVQVDGNAVGEMKHGPLTRITRQTAVVAIAPRSGGPDTMAIDLDEIRTRAGFTIAITTAGDDHIGTGADAAITIPPTLEWLQPVLVAVPLQLLAYHLGVLRGHESRQNGRTQWQPAPAARL